MSQYFSTPPAAKLPNAPPAAAAVVTAGAGTPPSFRPWQREVLVAEEREVVVVESEVVVEER